MKNRTQASVHLNALLRTRTSLSETRFTSAIPLFCTSLVNFFIAGTLLQRGSNGKRLSKSTVLFDEIVGQWATDRAGSDHRDGEGQVHSRRRSTTAARHPTAAALAELQCEHSGEHPSQTLRRVANRVGWRIPGVMKL